MSGSKKDKESDEKEIKINKWDGAAVKNALDDGIKKVLVDDFGYKESHSLMDMRLVICTVAVACAMYAVGWDYIRPFPESRPILITCVLAYFVLMGILTIYTTYKERGIFLIALQKDRAGVDADNVWVLSSYVIKYDHIYNLSVKYTDGTTGTVRESSISKSLGFYFDDEGVLCTDNCEKEVKKLLSGLSSDKKEK